MSRRRGHDAWNHTASAMALFAECHRNPDARSDPFDPHEFHPYYAARPKRFDGELETMDDLKQFMRGACQGID